MDFNKLKNDLLKLHEKQDDLLKKKYDRSLSFQDGLFDRFTRAKKLGFGDGASIYNSASVFGAVKIGNKTWIGPNVLLDGSGGGIEIGEYCSISAGVHIYTHDSVMWALSGGKSGVDKSAVKIGNNTYIGAQSIIKAGVKIGSYCVIGANSYINKSVADYSIVVGSPGSVVGVVVIENEKIQLNYFK